MKRTAVLFLFSPLLLLLAAPALRAQGIVDLVVSADTLSARIELPEGIGADLTIAFEKAVGLTADALGLAAQLVDPTDLSLLSRLPSSVAIPAGFPVLLHIAPPATGGLSFSGVAAVNLHTHNLPFAADTPLRLFRAAAGGGFEDVTQAMGMGSYRVNGTSGGFSEWMIVTDTRAVDVVINGKFYRLEGLLDAHEALIAPAVHADLVDRLAAAHAAYQAGALVTAIQQVEGLAATVKAHSGTDVPDVWRSAGDLANVAGALRAAADTLRFSLNLKSNAGGLL
ncbi:MAG: DUF6689 family protein [Thermoanaerobaculia bacterium]